MVQVLILAELVKQVISQIGGSKFEIFYMLFRSNSSHETCLVQFTSLVWFVDYYIKA